MRLGEQPAQIRVPLRCLGKQNEMAAVRERDFGTGDRLQVERFGGVRECERAVYAVAIRECQSWITEVVRCGEQRVRRRGAVEKRKCGVAVELGVHGRSRSRCGGQKTKAAVMGFA